jgi:hexosaminidase
MKIQRSNIHTIILFLVLLTFSLNGFAQIKGFHLDLRIQVMKMPALKAFAKNLSAGGVNTLVMEWEATYPFQNQPLIANRYAYTREDIKSFVAYCKSINIDVIPLQQSFGHVEYILRNNKYAALREDQKDFSQINPLKEEEARALFTDLYMDLISTHSSPYIHIGGDETYLLGHSAASKKKIADVGIGRLYGDYIKMLCEIVVGLGKRPVVWADIAMKYPEALKVLPKETIFVDWNYGWDLNHFGDHQALVKQGFEIWGAPSIRSSPDNYYLTDWKKHFDNIKDFVPQSKKLGYKGIVMTSWSTSGIYSTLFESSSDIIDLHAVRRVYPVTGFNMLIAAYLESIKSDAPLNVDAFIGRYGKDQYGFDKTQTARFWSALTRTPYEISRGKPAKTDLSINQILDSARLAKKVLDELEPANNKAEFEHYRLMAAIREQYLNYESIDAEANAPGCTADEMAALVVRLKAIRTEVLDKKFEELNRSALHPAEIEQENQLRNVRIKLLIDRLSRNK